MKMLFIYWLIMLIVGFLSKGHVVVTFVLGWLSALIWTGLFITTHYDLTPKP